MDHRIIKTQPANAIASPCTGVCTMDAQNKHCIGCYRTRLEIGGWAHMDNDTKLVVIKDLRKRRQNAPAK